MNRIIIAGVAAAGIALAACTPTQVATGAGGAAGALIVAALGGTPAQIAIGGAIGAGTGFVVGELTRNRVVSPGVCHAVNQYGQELYVTRSGQIVTYRTPNPLLVQC